MRNAAGPRAVPWSSLPLLLSIGACAGVIACARPAASSAAAASTSPATAPSASAPAEPPADPATLATPGPAASPCTSDAMCLNHRCNLQYGKCAFPCVTNADCVRGTTCFKAVISTCQRVPPNQP